MKEFEEYLRKYAQKHSISIEEAKQHAIVQNVKDCYENKEKFSGTWW